MAEQIVYMHQGDFIRKVLEGERDFRGITLDTQDTALHIMDGYKAMVDYCRNHDPYRRVNSIGCRHLDLDAEPLLLDNADFSGVQAIHLHMPYARGRNVRFKDANLEKASFHHAQFPGEDAQLQGADFRNVKFQGADLVYFWSPKGYFLRVDFSEANLSHANLHGAHFAEADLRTKLGATFAAANLSYANLGGAHLNRANFHGADLEEVYFVDAWLQGANFEMARLKNTRLAYAKLEGARLVGTKCVHSLRGLQKAVMGALYLPQLEGKGTGVKLCTTVGPEEAKYITQIFKRHKRYEIDKDSGAVILAENTPDIEAEALPSVDDVVEESHPAPAKKKRPKKKLKVAPGEPGFDDLAGELDEFDTMSDDELLGIEDI